MRERNAAKQRWVAAFTALMDESRAAWAQRHNFSLASLETWLSPSGAPPDPSRSGRELHDAVAAPAHVRKLLEAAWAEHRGGVAAQNVGGSEVDLEGLWYQRIDESPVHWGGRRWYRHGGGLKEETIDVVEVETATSWLSGSIEGSIRRVFPDTEAGRLWRFSGAAMMDAGWSLYLRFWDIDASYSRGLLALAVPGQRANEMRGVYVSRHFLSEADPSPKAFSAINTITGVDGQNDFQAMVPRPVCWTRTNPLDDFSYS